MSRSGLDTDRIVCLLVADAVATLGAQARDDVLAVAESMEEIAQLWLEQGDSAAQAQRAFDREVVDHFHV